VTAKRLVLSLQIKKRNVPEDEAGEWIKNPQLRCSPAIIILWFLFL
jgi:hypothetical protein